MARRTTTTPLEATIRENVRRLIKEHYAGKPGQVARKNENVTLSRLQEFLAGKGATLPQLQTWADALHVKPYQLLIPDLNVQDPQELVSGKKLRQLEKLRQELLSEDK